MAFVLTNQGRGIASGLVTGVTTAKPANVGVGSGAGTSAVADTTLFTEYTTGTWAGYARVVATATQATTTVINDTAKWVATFTAPAAETVTNAGSFDAATVGDLFIKGDFVGVALAANDSLTLTITWQLQ